MPRVPATDEFWPTASQELLARAALARDEEVALRAWREWSRDHALANMDPASMNILEERLRNRGSDSEDVINRRLGVARQEAAQWRHFDYLLVSDTPEEDTRRGLAILQAERMRPRRAVPPEL